MNAPLKVQKAQAQPPAKPITASPLQVLIAIEGEALEAKDILSLRHIAVNRPRALLKFGHVIWVHRSGQSIRLDAISSQSQIDKTSPFVQWMTSELVARLRKKELDKNTAWQFNNTEDGDSLTYPFSHAYYAPFSPDPKSGSLIYTRLKIQ